MKKRVIAMILATIIGVGYLPLEVVASEKNSLEIASESNEKKSYVKGEYKVSNKVLKIDSDNDSAARKYVGEESNINISKDKITTTLDFTEKTLMSNIKVKVNGKEVKYSSTDVNDKKLTITFNLDSLEDNIEVSSTINTGFFKMDVSFKVKLDTTKIPLEKPELPEEKPSEQPDNGENGKPEETPGDSSTEKPSEEDSSNTETNKPNEDNSSNIETNKPNDNENIDNGSTDKIEEDKPSDGNEESEKPVVVPEVTNPSVEIEAPTITENKDSSVYKIKNEIITSSAIGYSAARAAVNSTSYLEEINGEKYVTVGLSQLNVMNNIRVTVDGKKINYQIVRKNNSNHTMDIRFKVSSINSNIKITAFITMTEMDISFGLDLLESTKELVSKSEVTTPLAKPSTLPLAVTTDATTGASKGEEEKTENTELAEVKGSEIEVKEYFKKFTIENDIISDSAMGKAMTRKYLDKVSILEEIDGKLYLTVKFSGTTAMDNIKIKINGEEKAYDTVASDETKGIKAFRFEIKDINDEIRVYMFIKPVKMNIDFGIDLLEETKTLIEEGTGVKEEKVEDKVLKTLMESNNKNTTNTGKLIGITVVTTALIIALIEGLVFLFIKKKKKKITK